MRLRPNHPADDPRGVTTSILERLLYGCGDAMIGIDPATDTGSRMIDLMRLIDERRQRYDMPVLSCVLTSPGPRRPTGASTSI